MKKTVIIGATPNESRYAYLAANMLHQYHYDFVPLGIKQGIVLGKQIFDINSKPAIEHVDTVTMYIGPQHQSEWYAYIISLKPNRVIFNPGTENEEFETLLKQHCIEPIKACTLVMLRTGQF